MHGFVHLHFCMYCTSDIPVSYAIQFANHTKKHAKICDLQQQNEIPYIIVILLMHDTYPDSKVHGVNMEPTWGW